MRCEIYTIISSVFRDVDKNPVLFYCWPLCFHSFAAIQMHTKRIIIIIIIFFSSSTVCCIKCIYVCIQMCMKRRSCEWKHRGAAILTAHTIGRTCNIHIHNLQYNKCCIFNIYQCIHTHTEQVYIRMEWAWHTAS